LPPRSPLSSIDLMSPTPQPRPSGSRKRVGDDPVVDRAGLVDVAASAARDVARGVGHDAVQRISSVGSSQKRSVAGSSTTGRGPAPVDRAVLGAHAAGDLEPRGRPRPAPTGPAASWRRSGRRRGRAPRARCRASRCPALRCPAVVHRGQRHPGRRAGPAGRVISMRVTSSQVRQRPGVGSKSAPPRVGRTRHGGPGAGGRLRRGDRDGAASGREGRSGGEGTSVDSSAASVAPRRGEQGAPRGTGGPAGGRGAGRERGAARARRPYDSCRARARGGLPRGRDPRSRCPLSTARPPRRPCTTCCRRTTRARRASSPRRCRRRTRRSRRSSSTTGSAAPCSRRSARCPSTTRPAPSGRPGRARRAIAAAGSGATLVDLGAGDCRKAEIAVPGAAAARYVAVDVSRAYLPSSLASLAQRHRGSTWPAWRPTSLAGLPLRPASAGGGCSSIPAPAWVNFDPPAAGLLEGLAPRMDTEGGRRCQAGRDLEKNSAGPP
jgi:hypothetical protein